MDLQFMKRSHVQSVGTPSIGAVNMTMVDAIGFDLDVRAATCTEVRNSNPSGVRGSNRVSQWIFRMLAILAVLFNGSMLNASQIKENKLLDYKEQYVSLVNDSEISIDTIIAKSGAKYAKIKIENYDNLSKDGEPEMPCSIVRFLVPDLSNNFRVSVIECDEPIEVILDYPILPANESNICNEKKSIFLDENNPNYKRNISVNAEIIDEQMLFGVYHIVTVGIQPSEYNFEDSMYKIFRRVKIGLSYDICDVNEVKFEIMDRKDSMFDFDINNFVVNGDNLRTKASYSAGQLIQLNHTYLIITTDALSSAFEDFAVWKRQKGYKVEIVTMEKILADYRFKVNSTTKIVDKEASLRSFLNYYYKTFGVSYVLLAGDVEKGFPCMKLCDSASPSGNSNSDSYFPTDMYFSDISSSLTRTLKSSGIYSADYRWLSFSPAFPVGRLICKDESEAIRYLRKLALYESFPGFGRTSYLNNSLCIIQSCLQPEAKKELSCAWISPIINKKDMIDIPDSISYTPSDVIRNMSGASIISFQGHGSPACIECSGAHNRNAPHITALDSYGIDITHMYNEYEFNGIDKMSNYDYPSVLYSYGCTTMPFDNYSGYHSYNIPFNLGSAYTTWGLNGGVAYIGNTREEWLSYGPYLENQFAKELVKYRSIGMSLMMSKVNFLHNSNSKFNFYSKVITNLLGDPELKVWMGSPQNRIWQFDTTNGQTYSIAGSDVENCVVSLFDGENKSYMGKISANSRYINLNLYELINFDKNNDVCCISIWKDDYLPKFYLTHENTVSISSKKSFILPELNICNSNSDTPCYYIVDGGELTIETLGDLTLDGVLYIQNGGVVNLKSMNKISLDRFVIKSGGTLNIQSNDLKFGNEYTCEKGAVMTYKKLIY